MDNRQNRIDWLKYMRFKTNVTDSDAVYKKVWTRIQENNPPALHQRKRRHISVFYKIAAVMLVLLGISGFYFVAQNFSQKKLIVIQTGYQSIKTVELPDGTIVKLGSNSILTYPEQFKKDLRRVEMDGQCFFQVKKDLGKPFIVHTSNLDVTVLGTQFEVFSYEKENLAEATLLSGKVKVTTTSLYQKENLPVTLHPNQKIILNKTNGDVNIEEINADKYLSWQESGILSFENESLSVIVPRLEQWFGCKIIYPETHPDSLRITLKVRKETIDEVLYMISLSTKYKYTQHTNTYKLY